MQPRPRLRVLRANCLGCTEVFDLDPRTAKCQQFCSKPACRKASKRESNRRWTAKNPSHHRGPIGVSRVQEWRKLHPDRYRQANRKRRQRRHKRPPAPVSNTQPSPAQPLPCPSDLVTSIPSDLVSLQDQFNAQQALLLGLIGSITANPLQDQIVQTATAMLVHGREVLPTWIARTAQPTSNLVPHPP